MTDPAETQITIHRQGESPRAVSNKEAIAVPEGMYYINATADRYEPQQTSRAVVSGKSTTVQLKLARRAVAPNPAPVPAVNQLFDHPDLWKQREDGFWAHEGTAWMKQATFRHTFEFFKLKKSFNRQEKVTWRIYFQGSDYIECEIDGSNYSRRDVIGGKEGEWIRLPHKLPHGNTYTVKLAVEPDGFSLQVGQATDTLRRRIDGRTALDGKVAVRLLE